MLIGFVFWYRGLALGGIAGVGQLQLLQPFFGLVLAALLLHEPVGWAMIAVNRRRDRLRGRRQAFRQASVRQASGDGSPSPLAILDGRAMGSHL